MKKRHGKSLTPSEMPDTKVVSYSAGRPRLLPRLLHKSKFIAVLLLLPGLILIIATGFYTFRVLSDGKSKDASTETSQTPTPIQDATAERLSEATLPEDTSSSDRVWFYLTLSNEFMSQDNPQKALEALQKAEAIDPQNKTVQYSMARAYKALGDATNQQKYEKLSGHTVLPEDGCQPGEGGC